MRKLRILVADDHETVREGLKAILNAQDDMEVVAEAVDGRTAVQHARDLMPDVVVMDVSMPKMNGLKAAEALRESCPDVKILALTRHSDDGYLQQMLKAGAVGYVLKQSQAREMLHAIRSIAGGGRYIDPAVAGRLIGEYRRRAQPAGSAGAASLTPREEEVLRMAAWGHSNKELAAQLGLSIKTVETHKTNAMEKLSLNSRVDIVRFALLRGWLQDN